MSGKHEMIDCVQSTGRMIDIPEAVGEAERAGRHDALPSLRKPPLWKRLVPFAVASVILAYLFHQIDARECLDTLRTADLSMYLPWLLAFILITFLLDTQYLAVMLRRFRYPIAWKDALGIRGVTYLLMTVDYTVGMGALIYYLKKNLSIPVMRSTGLMGFFNAITQKTLVYMSTIGLILLWPPSPLLRNFLYFCVGFVVLDLLFIVALKKMPSRGFMLRIKNLNLLRVFHEASWSSYGVLILWRSVYYALFIGFFHVALRAFHLEVPFTALLAYVPIILLVISMPITPCGFGTAQAAMLYLFKEYGPAVYIMAFGLTYSTSILVLRSVIGLCFANRITGTSSATPNREPI